MTVIIMIVVCREKSVIPLTVVCRNKIAILKIVFCREITVVFMTLVCRDKKVILQLYIHGCALCNRTLLYQTFFIHITQENVKFLCQNFINYPFDIPPRERLFRSHWYHLPLTTTSRQCDYDPPGRTPPFCFIFTTNASKYN